MDSLLDAFRAAGPALLAEIKELVEVESPSTDKQAVDRVGAVLRRKLAELRCAVEVVPDPTYGDCIIGRWQPKAEPEAEHAAGDPALRSPIHADRRPLLIICHTDTVWPAGTLQERPFRVEGGKAYGPGIFDMKSGIAFALFALNTLQRLGRTPRRPIVYLFNADEEIGSPSSRTLLEQLARTCAATLCLEPSTPRTGAVKTARSGWGRFEMRVRGRAAHAGAAHRQGINALAELAHQILDLHAMTDYGQGVTVTVCVAQGGRRPNVIPDEAMATIDVRARSPEDLQAVAERLSERRSHVPGTAIEVAGEINRPPFVRTDAVVALFEHARRLARELRFSLEEEWTGGVSDGNFTAAVGCPTIDGIGGFGDGAHAAHEHIVVDELPRRCALVARLLETL